MASAASATGSGWAWESGVSPARRPDWPRSPRPAPSPPRAPTEPLGRACLPCRSRCRERRDKEFWHSMADLYDLAGIGLAGTAQTGTNPLFPGASLVPSGLLRQRRPRRPRRSSASHRTETPTPKDSTSTSHGARLPAPPPRPAPLPRLSPTVSAGVPQSDGASMGRPIRRDSTIAVFVAVMLSSRRSRSRACSRCWMSRARTCTRALASPLIV